VKSGRIRIGQIPNQGVQDWQVKKDFKSLVVYLPFFYSTANRDEEEKRTGKEAET